MNFQKTLGLLLIGYSLLITAKAQTEFLGCASVKEIEIEMRTIRTTAYSHGEADHLKYGRNNAIGTPLQYGRVRSAAADWSRFPLGTEFRLMSDPDTLYIVDDYGSALVGKETIDLYKPSMSAMRKWGARNVEIEIIKWGSLEESLRVLKPRGKKARYVRRMIWA
ncbi:MAG: 3D domain-containing protein, partial [Verrucomicrobiales bacterium]